MALRIIVIANADDVSVMLDAGDTGLPIISISTNVCTCILRFRITPCAVHSIRVSREKVKCVLKPVPSTYYLTGLWLIMKKRRKESSL